MFYEKKGVVFNTGLRAQKQGELLRISVTSTWLETGAESGCAGNVETVFDLSKEDARKAVRKMAEYASAWLDGASDHNIVFEYEAEGPQDSLNRLYLSSPAAVPRRLYLTIAHKGNVRNYRPWCECPFNSFDFYRGEAEDVAAVEQLVSLLNRAIED